MIKLLDNSYLCLLDKRLTIVGSRSKDKDPKYFSDICEITDEEYDFISKSAISFSKYPVFLEKEKPVFLITTFYPSSNLVFAVVPDLTVGQAKKLVNEGFFGPVNTFENNVKPALRLSDDVRRDYSYLSDFLIAISNKVGILKNENVFSAINKVVDIFRTAADFIGCNLTADKKFIPGTLTGLDLSLVVAFALCVATFTRRRTIDNLISLRFDYFHNELSVVLSANVDGNCEFTEFEPLKNYFKDSNYDFAIINERKTVCFDFCPMRKDFALLGIKQDVKIKY